ncbi:hypothetical protein BDK51DRAFT_50325 [Blyttiomyces helicus]|uniref:Uncharacterized protein n=1 Tax=Blyttiomyces helicus TaxID=388810 RepID=A0A4P9VW40_9FUNG|nr:hypothetical protein BDK51DRAFT_50325 [Blyttiomyces helicus]|eukprot:RKO83065.1 hypothetical protein BDK51DRAFT_50325 [Blyttiomyces helicus]
MRRCLLAENVTTCQLHLGLAITRTYATPTPETTQPLWPAAYVAAQKCGAELCTRTWNTSCPPVPSGKNPAGRHSQRHQPSDSVGWTISRCLRVGNGEHRDREGERAVPSSGRLLAAAKGEPGTGPAGATLSLA